MLSVPLSPAPVPLMSRRVPLGSIQHNALSPLKTTSTVPAKRPANSSRDVAGSRPTKKPYIDGTAGLSYTSLDQKENRASMTTKTVPRTPSRHDGRRDGPASRIARPKATLTGSHHPPPVFQHDKIDPLSKVKKNVVQAKQSTEQSAKYTDNNTESIRQWQRHYRRQFPTLTFWFDDSVSEKEKDKLRGSLLDLRSTIMPHFSTNTVTHVITARTQIPPELPKGEDAVAKDGTINPLLLSYTHKAPSGASQGRNGHADELVVARMHKIKIWTTDKLKRMISTLNDPLDDLEPGNQNSRVASLLPSKVQRQPLDRKRAYEEEKALGALLREEKTRSTHAKERDMYYFKGPFILVGDAVDRYRPFIVKEYSKVEKPEEGDWPQFRANREGRCVFILDPDTRMYEREKPKEVAEQTVKEKQVARVKGKTTMEPPPRNQSLKATAPPKNASTVFPPRKPLKSIENKVEGNMAVAAATAATKNAGETRLEALRRTQRERQNARVLKGLEPVASGMRHAGPTSAIQSLTVSSNTATLGAKAGTSRDVQQLNRRVFERTTGGMKQVSQVQAVTEDAEDVEAERAKQKRRRAAKERPRAPVPGYCENCRDKYDDFQEHVVSKLHRKFAANDDNFKDLDDLLASLKRPLKEARSASPLYD